MLKAREFPLAMLGLWVDRKELQGSPPVLRGLSGREHLVQMQALAGWVWWAPMTCFPAVPVGGGGAAGTIGLEPPL